MSFTNFPIQSNLFTSYSTSFTGVLTWGSGSAFTGIALNSQIGASLSQVGLNITESVSGTAPNGQPAWNQIVITADTAIVEQGQLATPLEVSHTFGGGGMTGNRSGINVNSVLNGPASDTIQGGGSYGAFSGQGVGNASCGGTGLTPLTAKGNIGGGNFIGTLNAPATNFNVVTGAEFDVQCITGCSVMAKQGISITCLTPDNVQGTLVDAAIVLVNQPSAGVNWKNGILLSSPLGQWPFGSSSTFVGTYGAAGNLQYGIDLSGVTMTTGGAMFLAPLATPSSSTATGKTGSIVWDANFIYICTATNNWKRATLSSF